MKASKSQIKAQEKYDKANTVQLHLKLNKKTDADIIGVLRKESNKQGLIKDLLRLYAYVLNSEVKTIDNLFAALKEGEND